jgi:hypothetical protein
MNKFTDYNEYLKISKKVKEIVIISLNNLKDDKKLFTVLCSIAHHLILDLYKLTKTSFELDLVKKKLLKKEILSSSMILLFLSEKNTEKFNFNNFGNNSVYTKKDKHIFSFLEKSIRYNQTRFNLKYGKSNYFLHNQSYLLNSLLKKSTKSIFLRPEKWPTYTIEKIEVEKIYFMIFNKFKKFLKDLNIDKSICQKAEHSLKYLINPKIIYSLSFYKACESLDFKNVKNKFLIGGAPQILGKILNYFFRINGGKVRRFAHGGDRVFFSDYFWGLSELPFCDEYYVHSKAEKLFLEKKLKTNKIYNFNNQSCIIKTCGSPKHQKILIDSNKQKKKKILFIPGALLGEEHQALPEFKVPDYLMVDYHIWLLKKIRSFGFDLSVKVHPFGLNDSKYLNKICNNVITTKFDILLNTSSVLIFDFAGSAFFDSLASNKGIILLNTGVRPFFFDAHKDLKKRCNIVNSFFDQKNRIRFDTDELESAIGNAFYFSKVNNSFAKKYFFK